jgi:hypothetical protein
MCDRKEERGNPFFFSFFLCVLWNAGMKNSGVYEIVEVVTQLK